MKHLIGAVIGLAIYVAAVTFIAACAVWGVELWLTLLHRAGH